MGSFRPASTWRVPGASVYKCCCVRSIRRLARRASANMLMPTTIAATAIRLMTAERARRCIGLVRLSQLDDHRVDVQPEPDERSEEHQVAHADHAAGEVLEPVDHRE